MVSLSSADVEDEVVEDEEDDDEEEVVLLEVVVVPLPVVVSESEGTSVPVDEELELELELDEVWVKVAVSDVSDCVVCETVVVSEEPGGRSVMVDRRVVVVVSDVVSPSVSVAVSTGGSVVVSVGLAVVLVVLPGGDVDVVVLGVGVKGNFLRQLIRARHAGLSFLLTSTCRLA